MAGSAEHATRVDLPPTGGDPSGGRPKAGRSECDWHDQQIGGERDERKS